MKITSKLLKNNYLAKFDEINQFSSTMWIEDKSKKEVKDYLADTLLEAYVSGFEWANEVLGIEADTKGKTTEISTSSVRQVINQETAGKTPENRILSHYDNYDEVGIERVLSTETHRVFNESSLARAKSKGAKYKIWVTVGDEKVRIAHQMLEGTKIPIDEYFEVDGDKALAPGGFNSAELNCNCRCILKFE